MDVGDAEKIKARPDPEILQKLAVGTRTRGARRILLWSTGAVLVAALAAWYVAATGTSRAAYVYVTEPVIRGDLKVIVTATGSVQPLDKVDVSSELSGTVRRVLVDYNSIVTAGQTLAELDTDKLRASLESARAKLAAANAQLVEAQATVEEKRRDLQRKRALAERQVTTAQDLDSAKAAFDRAVAAAASASAQIDVAESDVRLGDLNLSKACICSPIDGIVLSRNVDPGQTVASSFQAPVLFSIAQDLTQMEIQVDVDEADVGQVRDGQDATFSVDAYTERKFDATVRMVRFAPETVQGVVTYKAVLDVDNKDRLLRPGMTATAEIVVERVSDAVMVPNAALRFAPPAAPAPQEDGGFLSRLLRMRMPFTASAPYDESGQRKVWQLRDGVPVSIPVTTGPTDGRFTVVRDGALTQGQAVIVDSAPAKG